MKHKHTDYLNRKPGAIVALEKRIDDLRKPVIAASAFMGKVQDDLIHAETEFRRIPNLETAAAWDSAITRDKTAKANSLSFELSQQVGHAQRALMRASVSTFTPFLGELVKLLNTDIEDTRKRINRSLAEVEAEVDPESVRPLPELRAKLSHVQELYNRSGNTALVDDTTVDSIFALFSGGLEQVRPAPARAPVREGFITENNRLHRERLAQLEEATPVTFTPVPPVAKGPVPLTRDQESYLRALERQQADERALNLRKLSEAAPV